MLDKLLKLSINVMLSMDDEMCLENQAATPKNVLLEDKGFFNGIGLVSPIVYNIVIKKFLPGNKVRNLNGFMGWVLDYNNLTNLVDVLYKGFLLKDSYKFSSSLKPQFILSNIEQGFKHATESIIEAMPRIKKLKRLNLKMITKEHAKTISYYLDNIIRQYEIIYDYESALMLKAQLVTSPFYVNDNGIIKLYSIETNELTIPDLESEGYFLAYFSFVNKINKNN